MKRLLLSIVLFAVAFSEQLSAHGTEDLFQMFFPKTDYKIAILANQVEESPVGISIVQLSSDRWQMMTVKVSNWDEIHSQAREKYPIVFADDLWRPMTKEQLDSLGRFNWEQERLRDVYILNNLSFEIQTVEVDSLLLEWLCQYVKLKDSRNREKPNAGANIMAKIVGESGDSETFIFSEGL